MHRQILASGMDHRCYLLKYWQAVLSKQRRRIETTLRYYAAQDADDVASDLWREFGNITSINTPENPPKKEQEAPNE